LLGCFSRAGSGDEIRVPKRPYYFLTLKSHTRPIEPTGEIGSQEAAELARLGKRYYVAYYDEKMNLVRIERFIGPNKVTWWDHVYRDGTISKTVVTTNSGEKHVIAY
jgi:hypothetical protein